MRRVRKTKRRPKASSAWTAHDVAILTELYRMLSNCDLAIRLGRSEWAVVGKARGLGLTKDCGRNCRRWAGRGRPWSSQEMNLLRALYPTTPNEDIAERIGRRRNAVHMKARQMELRKMEFWSEQEDQRLCEAYRAYSYDELAQRLGRTLPAVKARAITLKLDSKVPNWTEEEIRFLRESYGTRDVGMIAGELGRTRAAVAKKAREMGLVCFRHWSGRDVRRLRELYPCCTIGELAEEFGRSCDSIRGKAAQLRLSRRSSSSQPTETVSPKDAARSAGACYDRPLASCCI
jgi:hypothetical protein